jgi:hypothetical protein
MIKTFKNAQNITNKFWNTKPVMKKNTNIFETKIIDTNIEEKSEQTKLPDGFVWEEISYDNGSSVCDFINKYYYS